MTQITPQENLLDTIRIKLGQVTDIKERSPTNVIRLFGVIRKLESISTELTEIVNSMKEDEIILSAKTL